MMVRKECVVCGKAFMPKVHNQKTCSQECRDRYMAEYRREYYRNADKEKRRERQREYYRRNRDKIRERQNRWFREHCRDRETHIDDIFNAFNDYLKENYD